MAAAAVLAGARSMTVIAEWAAEAPQSVRAALGARRDAPGHYSVPAETTIRGPWPAWSPKPWPRRSAPGLATATASSGSGSGGGGQSRWTARRSRRPTRRPAGPPVGRDGPHHPCGAGPTPGRRRPGEVPPSNPYWSHFTVKANQPTLLDRCAALAWHNVPIAHRTRDRAGARAKLAGVELPASGYVLSDEPDGTIPWLPDRITRRVRRLIARLGLSGRLHDLRHFSATQLLTSGVDLGTVAGQLGYGGGGATTLRVSVSPVTEADRRAAELLRQRLPTLGNPT